MNARVEPLLDRLALPRGIKPNFAFEARFRRYSRNHLESHLRFQGLSPGKPGGFHRAPRNTLVFQGQSPGKPGGFHRAPRNTLVFQGQSPGKPGGFHRAPRNTLVFQGQSPGKPEGFHRAPRNTLVFQGQSPGKPEGFHRAPRNTLVFQGQSPGKPEGFHRAPRNTLVFQGQSPGKPEGFHRAKILDRNKGFNPGNPDQILARFDQPALRADFAKAKSGLKSASFYLIYMLASTGKSYILRKNNKKTGVGRSIQ